MKTLSLIFMLATQILVTAITLFFFFKMLFAKPKPEPDSYLDNDDVPR